MVLLLFWLTLFENTFSFGLLYSFDNGLEIKFSILIKALIVITCLDLFLKGKLYNKPLRAIIHLIFVMVLFSVYGLFLFPENFTSSFSTTIQTVSVLLIIPYLLSYSSKINSSQIFLNQLRIFAIFNAICVIISYFFPRFTEFFESNTSYSDIGRSFGVMGDEIAIFLTFFIIDSLHKKSWIVFTFLMTALFFTASIGPFLTLTSVLLFYFYKSGYFSFKYFIRTSFFSIIIITFTLFYFDNILQLSLFQRININLSSTDDNSLLQRVSSFKVAIETIIKYPFFGVGFGSYSTVIRDSYSFLSNSELKIISSAFNQYLQIICEMGVVGFSFFLNFIIKTIKNIKPNFNADYYIVIYCWVICFFVTIQSANWFLPSSFNFFLLVSLISLSLIKKKNERIFK